MSAETLPQTCLFERYRGLTPAQQRLLLVHMKRQDAEWSIPPSAALARSGAPDATALGFSLLFFSDRARPGVPLYELLMQCAERADAAGLEAIWVPERHFHDFGGPFPNPALLACAIAGRTSRIGIRAGSVVLPLHNPIRVVEDWSVVDNLSGGRCGVAVASGWHPVDFRLLSEVSYEQRRPYTLTQIDRVNAMWQRRTPIRSSSGGDQPASGMRLHPLPVQPILPLWLTSTSRRQTWLEAARRGMGVLTGLLEQTKDDLFENIGAYRKELACYHAPGAAKVTLMLHCLLGPDPQAARAKARLAMTEYFRNHMQMYLPFVRTSNPGLDVDALSQADRDALVVKGVERYLAGNALVGSAEAVDPLCRQLHERGVDEIACLVDFGPSSEDVLETIAQLEILVPRATSAAAARRLGKETPK
ncbi:MupA/Atu3671 family FMN-dependent luciferase-like monooxygenase [Bradyrhizobium sp. SZCCHNR1051]|uniref:MupA/Atu3671 family FMN-dependent luciferase-like monooxygenase n=1 Tax=Bradyrhizobium sp. SZCCHNR1051 TaxID=3057355 RepID=UPI0029160495|nr:MupA/Atu3671 family FMN-dependent luciferase-like monooxygenase [Bradyrhizobium sp. SZCCHNR1051]